MAAPGEPLDSSSEDGSGGYGDLGELSSEETDDKQLQVRFEQAAQHLPNLLHVASSEHLLYLYARYKQVKVGKCTTNKPGFFDFEGKRKWEAWKALGDYNPQQAMEEYIDTVKKLDPEWTPKDSEEASNPQKKTFGPVVSCLYKHELLRDEDKDVFDYCRENNIAGVSDALASGIFDVNQSDDEGRCLIHWACDRGHLELVSLLLFHNADINMQDAEGQTPLHYASACEFSDIVDLLLEHGANPSIVDHEGYQPHEATDNKKISEMLLQHPSYAEYKPFSL
ncbi:acyl-CoA-binding domain-containing protein 6 [Discoglossus pictus]